MRRRRVPTTAETSPSPGSFGRACRRFRSGTGAAAAVEFALVVIPFLGFVGFVFEMALYHFSLQSLDYATRAAARQIMVGSVPSNAQTLAGFKTTLICPKLLVNLDCSAVVVNAYKVAATSDAAANTGIYQFINAQTTTMRSPATQSTFCLGGPSDYVFLDVAYTFPMLFGSMLVASGVAPKGLQLRSTAFFRNEPFSAAGNPC